MRKPNRCGCIPSEDVCLAHSEPLVCRHGCSKATVHDCIAFYKDAMVRERVEAVREFAKWEDDCPELSLEWTDGPVEHEIYGASVEERIRRYNIYLTEKEHSNG
jgi:hypothetical protein